MALARDLIHRIESARALDPTIPVLGEPIRRLTARQSLGDLLHGAWLGHPAHPAAVDLPIGSWVSATLLDFFPGHEDASRTLIAIGLVSSLPAIATGLADWSTLGVRQQRVGLVHATANAAVASLFTASWAARRRGKHRAGKTLALAGIGGAVVGARLGGHLVYVQGSGVRGR